MHKDSIPPLATLLMDLDEYQDRREYSMEVARIAKNYEFDLDVMTFVYDARDANHAYLRTCRKIEAMERA